MRLQEKAAFKQLNKEHLSWIPSIIPKNKKLSIRVMNKAKFTTKLHR